MILINNKLVSLSSSGQIIIEQTPYRKVGCNKFEHWFDSSAEVSRADLERLYVFEILREDKEKNDHKKFLIKLDDLLFENNIIKE